MAEALAPIVLFVYNRPEHTRRTLESLAANELAKDSVLYIFSDGPKPDADEKNLANIKETRTIIKQRQWCGEVHIVERDKNKGLADSIIEGVTEVVNIYGKVIVLEDDIVTSKGFLKYMNEALNAYEDEKDVFEISAYMFPISPKKLPDTFFYKANSCWGWGTWKRAWGKYNDDAFDLYKKLVEQGIDWNYFNAYQGDAFKDQFLANVENRIKTWAVKWHAALYLYNATVLHPKISLVQNIGFDGSGENCIVSNRKLQQITAETIKVEKTDIKEDLNAITNLKNYFQALTIAEPITIFKKAVLRNHLRHGFSKLKALVKNKDEQPFEFSDLMSQQEYTRLHNMPRYIKTETQLFAKKIEIVDSVTYLGSLQEIFREEIYKFNLAAISEINMIDCGANIGLASIYLKKRYPTANITAFEADPNIFLSMKKNFESFGFGDIHCVNEAVSDEENTINFHLEGGHSGMITNDGQTNETASVKSIRLRNILRLYQHISFLKIDIEGHETKVIPDIKEELHKVQFLFLEYHSFINQDQQLDGILKTIAEAGMRYYIREATNKKDPFIQRDIFLKMDLLVNIFCYRD